MLEEREGNITVARKLFRMALQIDPNNDVVWKSWVAMEEREGNAVRADELRSLYQQQVTRRPLTLPHSYSHTLTLSCFHTPMIPRSHNPIRAPLLLLEASRSTTALPLCVAVVYLYLVQLSVSWLNKTLSGVLATVPVTVSFSFRFVTLSLYPCERREWRWWSRHGTSRQSSPQRWTP